MHERISGMSANATAFQIWLSRTRAFDSVRFVLSAGQPTTKPLFERLVQAFPMAEVIAGYGCTENVNRISFFRVPQKVRFHGSILPVGRPIAGVAIDFASTGEILLSGQSLMRGYFDELSDAEGRCRSHGTGDLGHITDEGDLVLDGRVKTQVNVGNEMVSPEEVEAAISSVPGVLECAAGGIPDPVLGEAIAAICVLASGGDRQGTEAEVRRRISTGLSQAKRPRDLRFTLDESAIPHTEYGKVDRKVLQDLLRTDLEASQ